MPIRTLTLRNLLSFKEATIDLRPLNVLIGPNASGKSNLISAVSLLRAAATELNSTLVQGGGVRAWIWKGGQAVPSTTAIGATFDVENGAIHEYLLEFGAQANSPSIQRELIRVAGENILERNESQITVGGKHAEMMPGESALSRFRSPLDPVEIRAVSSILREVQIYRHFDTGPNSSTRMGVNSGAPKDRLLDGGSNLATVLHEMGYEGTLDRVTEYLARFSDTFIQVKIRLEGGIAQVYMLEKGLAENIPATRLSDGTLRFLCLLAVLLQPSPPPVVCIEEPELGLHPDAIPLIAEALMEASSRTQLIVTTHSDALVDALSATPESVVVCERGFDGGSEFRRLERGDLDVWLKQYGLGELWRKGEIGGNRW